MFELAWLEASRGSSEELRRIFGGIFADAFPSSSSSGASPSLLGSAGMKGSESYEAVEPEILSRKKQMRSRCALSL